MKATELSFHVVLFIWLCKLILPFNPRTYGGGGWHNVFLSFILEDKKPVPDVFSIAVHSSFVHVLRQV